jgi:hypothetical protein
VKKIKTYTLRTYCKHSAEYLLFLDSFSFVLNTVYYLGTRAIIFQTFSLTAAQKSEEIGREAEKADRLLYQILPKTVAKKLLKGKQVSSIHFKRTISRMINIVLNDFIICEIRSVLEMLSTKSN